MTGMHAPVSLLPTPTTQPRPVGRPKRWIPGIVLPVIIVLGVGMFALSVISIISETSGNLRTAPRLTARGTIRVHLASGGYALYENVEDASYPLDPASVTVVGPSGQVRTVSATSDLSEMGSPLDTTVYGSVVGFTAQSNGNYVITATSGQTVLLGKSFNALVDSLARWAIGVIAGFLAVVCGLVLRIMWGCRHRGRVGETTVPGQGSQSIPGQS
jgi:hypothetical protein